MQPVCELCWGAELNKPSVKAINERQLGNLNMVGYLVIVRNTCELLGVTIARGYVKKKDSVLTEAMT